MSVLGAVFASREGMVGPYIAGYGRYNTYHTSRESYFYIGMVLLHTQYTVLTKISRQRKRGNVVKKQKTIFFPNGATPPERERTYLDRPQGSQSQRCSEQIILNNNYYDY